MDNSGTPGVPHVVLTSSYDTVDDRTAVSDNLGGTTTYGYNFAHEMTSVGMTATGLAAPPQVTLGTTRTTVDEHQPLRLGRRRRKRRQRREWWQRRKRRRGYVNTAIGYDAAGRITSISHTSGSNTLASYNMTWDAAGQLTQEVSKADGTENYTYDPDGELTSATGWRNESYSYDATGNRTMTGYQTGTGNELLSDGTFQLHL